MVKPVAFKVCYSKVVSIADSARHAPCRKKASQAWCRKKLFPNFTDPRQMKAVEKFDPWLRKVEKLENVSGNQLWFQVEFFIPD